MITAHHLVFGRKYQVPGNKILDLPLQNNFTDATGKNTMIAGGTSNLPTFTLEGGEYAATFNGSQSLKTNSNFVLGTDKVSISFWMKTNQTAISVPIELSSNPNINNAFSINTNYPNLNEIYGYSITQSPQSLNSARTNSNNIIVNQWRHIVFVIDRNLPINDKVKIYVNGNLATITKPETANTVGSFGSYPLFIGQRGGSSYGFNGQMKFLKIFNYPLSPTEITNLYNKTM